LFQIKIESNMQNLIKTLTLLFLAHISSAQVGINSDNSVPHSSAQLDVKSTTRAFYPPRMTTAQKNAIVSAQAGATVYDITLNQLSFYNGTAWVSGAGLSLPYDQSVNQFTGYDGGLFRVTNTLPAINGEAVAINGTITGGDGFAIRAMATNTSGFNTGAILATNASTNNNGFGISGSHAGGGVGITGGSNTGIGVNGGSTTGIGVNGQGGTHGIKGTATSTFGYGVLGEATGNTSTGVRGVSNVDYGTGVSGLANGAVGASGIYGFSNNGIGVEARSFNGIGLIASSTNNYALITTGGNVGIGVSAPTTILDVKSRIRIRNSAETSGIYFDGVGNTYKGFIGLETDNLTGIYGFNGANWAVKMDNTTGEWMATKGLSVGTGGTKIDMILKRTSTFDPPSIAANGSVNLNFGLLGANPGDQAVVTANSDFGPIVIGSSFITTANNITVKFINTSNVAVDLGSSSLILTIIR
jgi:hypothetical protein